MGCVYLQDVVIPSTADTYIITDVLMQFVYNEENAKKYGYDSGKHYHIAIEKNHCTGKIGTWINYLSTSFYDVEPGIPTSGKQLAECIDYLKTTAEKYGLTDLVFGVDEGRILYGSSGVMSCDLFSRTVGYTYMAAYDARLYTHLLNSGGSYLSSWDYLSEGLFEGNPSISYHVAKNIHTMAGMNRIQTYINAEKSSKNTEVGAIAGVDLQTGKMCIMIYNFGNSLNYASKAEISFFKWCK